MPESIEQVAAAWMVRSGKGLSASEEQAFAEWLGADPAHEAAFTALQATWDLMGESNVLKGMRVEPVQAPVRPDRPWFKVLGGLAAAAAVLVAGVYGWRAYEVRRPYDATEVTAIGAVREITLPDHSVIRLNTDSEVRIHYTGPERLIELVRGEGHFTVAGNAKRPFVVSAKGVQVRAVGTAFNVHLRPGSVDVLVTEGRVRLDEAARAGTEARKALLSDLKAGERTTVSIVPAAAEALAPKPPVAEPVSPAVVRQTLAWQERRLDFEAATLEEMVRELNRYSERPLVIADEDLKSERFGGTFPAGDPEAVVRMLETNFGVTAERLPDRTVLRRKR